MPLPQILAPHPAKYSDDILRAIADSLAHAGLGPCPFVLDPFAGTGRIHALAVHPVHSFRTLGIEIEHEWVDYHPSTILGDATNLEAWPDGHFDAIATSPCYGNRMADHHDARERCRTCRGTGLVGAGAGYGDDQCEACHGEGKRTYKRHTYRHYLGRPLAPNNAGAMQWGEAYRNLHRAAWAEAVRVLRPGGRFVLNMKDHVRKKQVVPVTAWHLETLTALGLDLVACARIDHDGLGHGENRDARVPYEWVLSLEKPCTSPS